VDSLDVIDDVLPELVRSSRYYTEFFRRWESLGVHVTPVHFYSPIADLTQLGDAPWESPYDLTGIDMNTDSQLRLLEEDFPRFRTEYEQLPHVPAEDPLAFYLDNGMFSGTDALVLYCMIRRFQPERVVEVGSGFSSRLTLHALRRNGTGHLVCIEPFPTNPGQHDLFREPIPDLELLEQPVQNVDLSIFESLRADDVLFIDSSHVARIGGDVPFLYLRVLPRLAPGVIVHVHDISLPFEYRREWVEGHLRFWNEQYLLHAFLLFNTEWQVLFANTWMNAHYPDAMRRTFPTSPWWGGGSFWMRRSPGGGATAA
jgi:predicted O-methyltransferase YrrM